VAKIGTPIEIGLSSHSAVTGNEFAESGGGGAYVRLMDVLNFAQFWVPPTNSFAGLSLTGFAFSVTVRDVRQKAARGAAYSAVSQAATHCLGR